MKTATQPFQFVTTAYLTQTGNSRASNLEELGRNIEKCRNVASSFRTTQLTA